MKKSLILLLVLWWPLSLLALNVSSLYQVEMSVMSQTEDIKDQAIKDGFAQVLMKVSGDPNILDNPLVRANLRRADYYVQDYSYSAPSTNSSLYTIVINYNEADVKRLLKKAGEQYWGQNRPLLLVWLTVRDQNNETQIIDSEADNQLVKMVRLGKRIGLPLLFPLMDMDDMNQVSVEDINNRSLTALSNAAKRYSPDGLLIGNVKAVDGTIDGDWELIVGKNKWEWSITDTSMDNMANGIVNLVGQTLSKYYIVKSNGKTAMLQLKIDKITERNDLFKLIKDIRQLSSVNRVAVSSVNGDQVDLEVFSHDDIDSFQESMAINRQLVLKSQDTIHNKLFYEWAR